MSDTKLAPVNMHLHTHYSFNAMDYTPTQLVQEARRSGIYSIAICDFDVLDALEEFYAASDAAPIRAAAGMETRVYFSEYGDVPINSPGEPGVYYFMGMGFAAVPPKDSPAGKTLQELRDRSRQRNIDLIARISKAYPELSLDYEEDVLPYTPSGNATERHIVKAYISKVREAQKEHEIWGKVLGLSGDELESTLGDELALQNAIRKALMKSGGAGYVKPDKNTFPPLEQVIEMILNAGAIPMATWLDGANEGEKNIREQLECLKAKGVAALNIIPDRNWNIKDPDQKAIKVANLNEIVEVADSMHLPINVGTEMNSPGQPFVDNFEAPAMRPHWPVFFKGAQVMVGQARLARFAGYSYCGEAAQADYADPAKRNEFFARVGALPCPNAETLQALKDIDEAKALACIRDSVRADDWKC
ncbi:MAG: PHP domain-containing protein [Candidatus Sumerlaeia bacterium]